MRWLQHGEPPPADCAEKEVATKLNKGKWAYIQLQLNVQKHIQTRMVNVKAETTNFINPKLATQSG